MKKSVKNFNNINKNKHGQITLFIIIAVVIVSLAIIIFLFFPGILITLGIGSNNPIDFIQNCIEEDLKAVIEKVSLQGGSLNPENFILYQDNKIEYLCYTEEYYRTCVMQQPFLRQQIENEIKEGIKDQANECFIQLEENFERQGYGVSLSSGETNVELLPERIIVNFDRDLTLTKDSSERFERISVVVNNNLYELVGIANSILNWEARFGDAETTTYMSYYKDLKVEKLKQSDGSTIYILTDRIKGNKFQFASRSVAWPPGFGIEGVI